MYKNVSALPQLDFDQRSFRSSHHCADEDPLWGARAIFPVKINHISLHRVCIPFKQKFKHSTRERTSTDNIVIETELEDGTRGYGEGLPRDYVTGETQDGVITALTSLDSRLFQMDFKDLHQVIAFLRTEILGLKNFPKDKENNTARAALELSLLDAYSRTFQKTFTDVASIALETTQPIPTARILYYDGVLSLDSLLKSLVSALKMKYFGFRRLKIKVGAEPGSILRRIALARKIIGPKVDLRIDANGAWNLETASSMIQKLLPYNISCIEQPLPHSEILEMRELKHLSPIPLMLDESLCTLTDAQIAIDNKLCDFFNIRLSKCGGFINSLDIAQLARKNRLGFQLGCLVGETGILSAAGRHFAMIHPDLHYLEGSFDHYLLKDNIIQGDISFEKGGEAHPLIGNGLGILINTNRLKKYSYQQRVVFTR